METEQVQAEKVEQPVEGRRYHPIATLFLVDLFRDRAARVPLFWAVGTLILGAIAFHLIEGWNYLDSLYYCVVSLATVGYGDLAPPKRRSAGRLPSSISSTASRSCWRCSIRSASCGAGGSRA